MTDEKDDKWEMPKPVFRSSTGDLPRSLQKTISGYNMPKDMADLEDDGEDDILSVMEHPATARPVDDAGTGELELEPLTAEPRVEPGPEHVDAPAAPAVLPEAAKKREDSEHDPAEDVTEPAPFVTAQAPAVKAAKPATVSAALKLPEKKRSGAGSFILIFLLIAALAAGLVWAIMYYISHRADSSAF